MNRSHKSRLNPGVLTSLLILVIAGWHLATTSRVRAQESETSPRFQQELSARGWTVRETIELDPKKVPADS